MPRAESSITIQITAKTIQMVARAPESGLPNCGPKWLGHIMKKISGSENSVLTRLARPARLAAAGVVTAADLRSVDDGTRVRVAGVVTHRQRPHTAGGVTFLNLEDETGLVNVVVSKGCWAHYREVAAGASALLIRGRVEASDGVVNVVAELLEPLGVRLPSRSRDFR